MAMGSIAPPKPCRTYSSYLIAELLFFFIYRVLLHLDIVPEHVIRRAYTYVCIKAMNKEMVATFHTRAQRQNE